MQKINIRHFHIVVMQKQERNVRKSMMHLQSCFFCLLNQLYFFDILVAICVIGS